MVKSEKIYSPQQYLEAVTGMYYVAREDDDIKFIEDRLSDFARRYDLRY